MTTSPRNHALRVVATRFLGRRARVVGPSMLVALVCLRSGGAPGPQLLALGTGFTLMLAFFQYEAFESRRVLFSAARVRRSLALTLLGIGLGCVATGGLLSPLLPMLFAPVVVGLAAFGLAREHRSLPLTLGFVLLWIGFATIFPPFPQVRSPQRELMLAAASIASLLLVHVGVAAFTDAHAALVADLARAREGLLSEALERTRSVESLGAKVAHEIKNPLASIRGLVELLGERVEDPRDVRRVEVLRGEVARLELLVHEYLTLARPLDDLRPTDTDLRRLTEEAAALLEGRARSAEVALTTRLPTEPTSSFVDGQRLLLALLNLLVNALEASPRGSEVSLALASDEQAVCFVVEDAGAGVSADVLPRLGQPYVSTKPGGTGLGVALARSVAEQHGGSLSFAARAPHGTVVRLLLPRSSPPR